MFEDLKRRKFMGFEKEICILFRKMESREGGG